MSDSEIKKASKFYQYISVQNADWLEVPLNKFPETKNVNFFMKNLNRETSLQQGQSMVLSVQGHSQEWWNEV